MILISIQYIVSNFQRKRKGQVSEETVIIIIFITIIHLEAKLWQVHDAKY